MSALTFDAEATRNLEAIYQAPDVVAQRARVLELLLPKAGERILDIGVGPAFLAKDLARAVGPGGRVVGLDSSPDMLAAARARLAGVAQAEVAEGDAAALPFPPESFDGAVSTQVYEYVADMPAALRSLHEVLRPGGRALILDTDWRSMVWHSEDPARMDRMLACWDAHLIDPHLPARLGSLLQTAGFEVEQVEALALLSPVWQADSYAAGLVRTIVDFARRNGGRHGLSPSDIDAWKAEQRRLAEDGGFFFSLNRYIFLARRS